MLDAKDAILAFHCLMKYFRIDAKAWGVGGSNLSVGLTLSVLISNFDSPLRYSEDFLLLFFRNRYMLKKKL